MKVRKFKVGQKVLIREYCPSKNIDFKYIGEIVYINNKKRNCLVIDEYGEDFDADFDEIIEIL